MTRTKTTALSQGAIQLVPISQLINIPEGIPIPFDHLQIADLSTLPRDVTLVTFLGPSIKVLITKSAELRVKVVCKVSGDDPLAQKFGVKSIARTMSYASGLAPIDQEEAKRLPSLTSAGWKSPDEVAWQFTLPIGTTGGQLLAAVQSADEFIMKVTEDLLTNAPAK